MLDKISFALAVTLCATGFAAADDCDLTCARKTITDVLEVVHGTVDSIYLNVNRDHEKLEQIATQLNEIDERLKGIEEKLKH
jgi:hypothetical protein